MTYIDLLEEHDKLQREAAFKRKSTNNTLENTTIIRGDGDEGNTGDDDRDGDGESNSYTEPKEAEE